MDLLFKTKKLISDNNLIDAGDHILVGVSGGIDSMVLLDIMNRLKDEVGFLLSVVHINHKLRGDDSEGDEQFVKNYCERNDIAFKSLSWSGPSKSQNLQDSARNFRFDSYVRTAAKLGCNKVALAHNKDDQAETVLLNLIRGSGLDGLSGMQISRDLNDDVALIRPILDTRREEIEKYASDFGVSHRNDITNDQTNKYSRNFLRHKVVPLLVQINPNVVESIARLSDSIKCDEEFLYKIAREKYQALLIDKNENAIIFDGSDLHEVSSAIRIRIFKLAYEVIAGSVAGITNDHLKKMVEIALSEKEYGEYSLPKGLSFEKKGARLAILRK